MIFWRASAVSGFNQAAEVGRSIIPRTAGAPVASQVHFINGREQIGRSDSAWRDNEANRDSRPRNRRLRRALARRTRIRPRRGERLKITRRIWIRSLRGNRARADDRDPRKTRKRRRGASRGGNAGCVIDYY